MHRFFLPSAHCQTPVLLLAGREAHHAAHVLRLGRGDQVIVLDGQGQNLDCRVVQVARDKVELKVLERHKIAPLPYATTLAQAIPKGKLFEDIIEKATELGVRRIVPLVTERTVGRFNKQEEQRKLEKWRVVAIEAIKQCGSAWLPLVEPPMTVRKFADDQRSVELPLVGSLAAGAQHPRTFFEGFRKEHAGPPKSVSVAIGPEGDFTPDELAVLQTAGARPITLGRLVLRTDTAAGYCLSVINYELQAPRAI